MHLVIAICAVVLAWFKGDWKHLGKYHKTILYVASAALLYEYMTKDFVMWDFDPDFPMPNVTITDLLYICISQPCAVLLFLSNYPDKPIKQVLHILKWVLIFVAVEWILVHFGRIHYEHGWNIWWSVLFDCIMFPMIRLHFRKPQWAYPISVVIVAFLTWKFHVPMKRPSRTTISETAWNRVSFTGRKGASAFSVLVSKYRNCYRCTYRLVHAKAFDTTGNL